MAGATVDVRTLESDFGMLSREIALEAANRWHSGSLEALYQGGEEHDYDVASVAQSALPPQWDASLGGFAFHFPHPAAAFFNDGTAPHEVEGDPLAFEWEEMEGEEFGDTGQTFDEVFADSWPTVFLSSVNVEGIEAIRFLERGEQQAMQYLEGR